MLSISSDFARDAGDPAPDLRLIAEAGFDAVHWCHHWNTDFLYSVHEIGYIGGILRECGLSLPFIHASAGNEKRWASAEEYRRRAGEDLVANRIGMAEALGAEVIVLHLPKQEAAQDAAPPPAAQSARRDAIRVSLDALEGIARSRGVRIALENMANDDFSELSAMFEAYAPDYIGLCYDCGHGNIGGTGLAHLERFKDRLIAVHLHDNDGTADQHRLPFDGTVEWEKLCSLISSSAYRKGPLIESNMKRDPAVEERAFLREAFAAAGRIESMIDSAPA